MGGPLVIDTSIGYDRMKLINRFQAYILAVQNSGNELGILGQPKNRCHYIALGWPKT